ncbi:MAG: hypothetical protein AB1324_00910 [Candidatus Micrarchaeota archaeon]
MALLTPTQIIAGSESLASSGANLWGYAGLAGLGLITSVIILTALYVWGTLFRNPQMNVYVKSELYEVVLSAILIPFIFGAVAAMSTLTIGSFMPPDLVPDDTGLGGTGTNASTNVYEATAHYYQRLDRDMSGWLGMNYVFNMYVDQLASVTPYARPLGVGLVASPLAGLASPIKQLLYNMSVALSLAFVINYAQLVVYIFSLQAFLKYYLPAGIFFRCFTPTRRLGGTLIGVSLAFLFVFPALSVITYSMFYNKSAGPLISFGAMLSQYVGDATSGSFSDNFNSFYDNNFTGVGGGVLDLIGGVFGGLGNLIQRVVGSAFLMLLIFPISVVSWAFALGFVVPAFNILIFTQAAKGLSKSFGDEVDISSLTRMI